MLIKKIRVKTWLEAFSKPGLVSIISAKEVWDRMLMDVILRMNYCQDCTSDSASPYKSVRGMWWREGCQKVQCDSDTVTALLVCVLPYILTGRTW